MNKSNRYEELMTAAKVVLTNGDIANLHNNYQFLLVKGFLGDALPEPLDKYFSEQMVFMKKHHIEHLRLEPDSGFGTQKLPENNVSAITTSITKLLRISPDKRVVIISHSKGGLDTLEVLLSKKLKLGKEVAGWIAMQTPFAGTPLADIGTGNIVGGRIIGEFLEHVFGGDEKVLHNMRTDVRRQYLADHSDGIAKLCDAIPVLSFASHISTTDPSPLVGNRNIIRKATRQDNDGVVPLESAILTSAGLPSCPFVRASHVDHFYPVSNERFASHKTEIATTNKRERLFATLLKIWLESQ